MRANARTTTTNEYNVIQNRIINDRDVDYSSLNYNFKLFCNMLFCLNHDNYYALSILKLPLLVLRFNKLMNSIDYREDRFSLQRLVFLALEACLVNATKSGLVLSSSERKAISYHIRVHVSVMLAKISNCNLSNGNKPILSTHTKKKLHVGLDTVKRVIIAAPIIPTFSMETILDNYIFDWTFISSVFYYVLEYSVFILLFSLLCLIMYIGLMFIMYGLVRCMFLVYSSINLSIIYNVFIRCILYVYLAFC